MNIKKTNPLGVGLIESRFNIFKTIKKNLVDSESNRGSKINDLDRKTFVDTNKESFMLKTNIFDFNKNQKIFRLTKNIIENCKLIDINSIKENININEFNFDSLIILLDNDSSGIIKINRNGTDFDFIYLKNLENLTHTYINTYSFLTKEFNLNEDCINSVFVIKILAYLYYGDITTKYIIAKSKVKLNSYSKFLNNSKINITYVDSLWKQRICVDGFSVRGHFRLQHVGVGRNKRKLIWIEEFKKDGYNRKATIELT